MKISKTKTKTKRLAAFNLSAAEAEVKFRNIRTASLYEASEKVLFVGNTKFSDESVEGPKFLSLQEYFANPKPMFSRF